MRVLRKPSDDRVQKCYSLQRRWDIEELFEGIEEGIHEGRAERDMGEGNDRTKVD